MNVDKSGIGVGTPTIGLALTGQNRPQRTTQQRPVIETPVKLPLGNKTTHATYTLVSLLPVRRPWSPIVSGEGLQQPSTPCLQAGLAAA